ncbi:MAG: choice-of-anchor J domain-containing protein [Candidatus Cloacimonetes bacterium]|nr:choice-of-anchor J domain-containing protein [Candidatus Cloacimonadota bacterium]
MKRAFLFLSIIALLSFANLFAQFDYSIELWDTYGDGWNDGMVDVLVNGEVVLSQLTILEGSGPESHVFTVYAGDGITTAYTAGNWSYENEYYIYDQNGNVVGSDGLDGVTPSSITTPIIVMGEDDIDLGAVGISGNQTPTEGNSIDYTVSVGNNSTFAVTDFTVKLMQVADGDDIELGSTVGTSIEAGEELDYVFTTTFTSAGNFEIYGSVEVANDISDQNDMTSILPISVQPSGTVVVPIGDGTEHANTLPANYYWKNSLTEQIYFAEEIQVGGVLTGIDFFYNFTEIPTISDLNVWVGETALTDLTGGFVPSTDLTPVYSGPFDYTIGDGFIHIPVDPPFAYGGGNIIVLVQRPMDENYYASTDHFYFTVDDTHPNRSVEKHSDSVEFDPAEVYTDGGLSNTFANTAFHFITEGMGAIDGVVTSDGNPLSDVMVVIDGTPATTYTNVNGEYSFPYVTVGTVSLTASKLGYIDGIATDVIVVENETTTVDIIIEQLANVQVSGYVYGSDYPTVGIEGAVVTLTGYADYDAVTDVNGMYLLSGVFTNNTYDIVVDAEGYEVYVSTIDVADVDLVVDDIIVMEVAVSAGAVTATPNDDLTAVDLVWSAPWSGSGEEIDENFDADTLPEGWNINDNDGDGYNWEVSVNWGGHNDSAHCMASASYRNDVGALFPDNWLISPALAIGGSSELHFWVAAQDPDWAAEQYYVKVSTSGDQISDFTNTIHSEVLSTDEYTEVVLSLADFAGQTVYIAWQHADVTDMFWMNLDDISVVNTRTREVSFSVDFETAKSVRQFKTGNSYKINYTNSGLVGSSLEKTITPSAPQFNKIELLNYRNTRALESYKIYRLLEEHIENPANWVPLAESYTDTSYTDSNFGVVANGVYVYAVVAVYTGENEAEATFSNTVAKGVFGTATFAVTTNDNISAEGAAIIFAAQDGNPEHVYEAIVGADGSAIIENVWFATYNLDISLAGYNSYTDSNIVFDEDATIEAELTEVMNPPSNLEVSDITNDTALITWDAPGAGSAAEFRYDDGIVTGQLGFGANPSAILGAAHPRNAIVNEVTWLLTSEAAHNEAIIYIFGLDGSGIPDTGQLLHESAPQPNVDDAWNNYVLPEAIEAPNGFFIGICTPEIFTAIGIDDGVDEPYVFQEGTQWGIADWTAGNDWLDVGPAGFPNNFTIRAYGSDLGDITLSARNDSKINYNNSGLVGSILKKSIVTEVFANLRETRELLGYNVYLDDLLVADTISDTEYLFEELEDGQHTAGVSAVYTNGSSEIIEIVFEIEVDANENEINELVTKLSSNYPNPFNPETKINFSTKENGLVVVEVYNVKGQKVKTLVNDVFEVGNHSVIWSGTDNNGKSVVSGIYFYKMKSSRYTATKKMILMK